MAAGDRSASEAQTFTDEQTGATVRRVTDQACIHHHPFYYLPAHDDAMRRLVFVSYRTGRAEVFCEERATGELVQLTDCAELAAFSVHPSYGGDYVYYCAGTRACRVDTETFEEQTLADFGDVSMREAGMVGAAMGTTTLSGDDRYWAVPVRVGEVSRFYVIDTSSGGDEVILEASSIGHPQFHPTDHNLLRYAKGFEERIWVVNRDGTGNRLVYERDAAAREWIVHEMWRPGSREIITTRWPRGCIGIDVDTGAVRRVTDFNAWHPVINRAGTLMCADTVYPDIGLQLFDLLDGVGEPRALCLTRSSNEGKHWDTDHCPYDDEDFKAGKWRAYAPQHTHPHPSFSPDGQLVVFTSDWGGHSQVYEVAVTV